MPLFRMIKAISILFILITVYNGCGEDSTQFDSEGRYLELSQSAVDLYSRLHPLRSSRLGLYGSDSLLFTFSKEELAASKQSLERLLDDLSHLPVAPLSQRNIDNSTIIIHWIKGELLALDNIQNHRRNPLLYCWMIEEALYGIPSRLQPPYQDELTAYENRLALIPSFLGNAAGLLESPAEQHVYISIDRLNALLGTFGTLKELINKRYSNEASGLEPARMSIERFRDFIAGDIALRTRGSIIMGLENISKILLYEEILDLDVNRFIQEAEKNIRKFKNTETSLRRDIERGKGRMDGVRESARDDLAVTSPTSEKPDITEILLNGAESCDSIISHLLDEIDRRTGELYSPEGMEVERPEIIIGVEPGNEYIPPVNPYLTIPKMKRDIVAMSFTPTLSGLTCRSHITAMENICELNESELIYYLLKASLPIREIDQRICEDGDSMSAFVSGDILRNAWTFLNMERIAGYFPEVESELRLLMLEEKIRGLARMVVVFSLHSGTLKTNEAAGYLIENINGMSREEAEFDVVMASASPSVAYAGIAVILLEDMARILSKTKSIRAPRRRLRRLLIEHRGLPLAMIINELPVDK